jgi:Cu-Zn family superoxide dismutase
MRNLMRKGALALGVAALTITAGTFLGGAQAGAPAEATSDARAILRDASGHVMGAVWFTQANAYTIVRADVRGLSPGFHGFHVHANNDSANGDGCLADPAQPSNAWFVSADGHYKLGSETHGAHQGDMPVLLMNGTGTGDSTATTRFRTDRFDVADIVGRAIITHALADNFANIPLGANPDQYTANSTAATDKTNATGNAGDRLLCGVVVATP